MVHCNIIDLKGSHLRSSTQVSDMVFCQANPVF